MSRAGRLLEAHGSDNDAFELFRDAGDWAAFVLFWLLAAIGILQFVTRYFLNDSLAWTEEIARYVLMCLTFVGGEWREGEQRRCGETGEQRAAARVRNLGEIRLDQHASDVRTSR